MFDIAKIINDATKFRKDPKKKTASNVAGGDFPFEKYDFPFEKYANILWVGVIFFGLVSYSLGWCLFFGLVSYSLGWCHILWVGAIFFGLVSYSLGWCHIIWVGVIFFGLVSYFRTPFLHPCPGFSSLSPTKAPVFSRPW